MMKKKRIIDPLVPFAKQTQFNELIVFIEANKFGEEFVDFAYMALDDYQLLLKLKQFYYIKTSQAFEEHFNEEAILMKQDQGLPEEDMLEIIELYGNNEEEQLHRNGAGMAGSPGSKDDGIY